MKLVKLAIAGIILAIIAQIIHTVGAILSMSYYTDPANAHLWSKLMMPSAGPPPASFMYMSFLFGFIGMFLFSWVYSVIKKSVPGNSLISKGFTYGIIVTLIALVPGHLAMILLLSLPVNLIIVWAGEGLAINLVNGVILGWINP